MNFFVKQSLFAACAIATIVSGCSEDEGISDFQKAPEGKLIANINAQSFVSATTQVYVQNGQISLVSIDEKGNNLVFSVFGNEKGTYDLSGDISNTTEVNSAAFTPAQASISNATFSSISKVTPLSGSIVISEMDKENKLISGSFQIELSRYFENSSKQDSVLIIKSGSFTKIAYTSEVTSGPDNTFTGKLDGKAFDATLITGFTTFGTLTISFSKGTSGEGIGISVPDDIAKGDYELSGVGLDYVGTYTKDANNTFEAESGTLKITKHDTANKIIEGSFNFKAAPFPGSNATGNPVISDCAFSLSY